MRTMLIWSACLFIFLGAGCAKKEKPAIKIDKIEISAAEFQEAYQALGSGSSRREFLSSFVNRKLMLKEAEGLGLDKDPRFLQSIQLFWEQSMMKLLVARQANELALIVRVSEQDINDYYQRHKDTDYAGKELSEVHDQIKFLISQIKKRLEFQRWNASLRRKAKIEIDYDRLNIPKDIK